ncbi:short chain dehydrogenase [Fomes fomentarius]|nr:short chain dehydrogenase [Fomes fomentarius]
MHTGLIFSLKLTTPLTMSASKLSTQTVLVLGGTSGIGYAVASIALAQSALHVTVSGSNPTRLESALSALRSAHPSADTRVSGFVCDLSKADELEKNIKALLDATVAANGKGKIDHIVFTAGDPLSLVPLAEISVDAIHRAGTIRYLAPVLLAKLLPAYIVPGYTSSLTLTGGVNTERPSPGWSVIASIIAGLQGLTRGLAVDLKPLRVNLVEPGAVETPMWDSLPADARAGVKKHFTERSTLGRVGDAEDTAEAYVYLMKDYFATGSIVSSNGGTLLV